MPSPVANDDQECQRMRETEEMEEAEETLVPRRANQYLKRKRHSNTVQSILVAASATEVEAAAVHLPL